LNYALFLGAMAAILGIIPYLGFALSFIPAVGLAAVQFQDWDHPLMVAAAFGLVNLNESFVVSPKIIGDRVGLHPLAIMIAMMAGTTLMGGVLGGLLAIPLTAALRGIMARYVWNESQNR
jgi:predicted PurR-regulated permease PerM